MTDFLDEVQELYKQESLNRFLGKYSKIILAVSLLIVLVSSVIVYYQYRQEQKQLAFSIKYFNAVQKKEPNDFKKIANDHAKGFSDMALLNYASSQNYDDGFKIFKSLAQDSKFEEIRNYAIYHAGMIALKTNKKEFLEEYVKIKRLTKGSAFKNLIDLINPLVDLSINKNDKLAVENIRKINTNSLSPDLLYLRNNVLNYTEN